MSYLDDPFFTGEPALKGLTQETAIDRVYNSLEAKEGKSGDTTGAAETGLIGVTQSAREAVGGSEDDLVIARKYLGLMDYKLRQDIPRYSKAPLEVQEALLDTAYNSGDQILSWEGMKSKMVTGDWIGALKQTLDTANVGGKTVKGLAKRRAGAYNLVADKKIDEIEQKEDGTLIYKAADGSIIFKYRKPKHDKSIAGLLKI